MIRILFSILLVMAWTLPAHAQMQSYVFDSAHTRIVFGVNHLGFTNQFGEFLKFDGGFHFDPDKPESSVVHVTIETASINIANNEKWNAHMRSGDFFDVENHPTMTFKSTSIQKTGDNTGILTGDLTLLGVTKPVTLNVVYNKTGVHPYTQNTIAGFSAEGMVKRSDFGMMYGIPGVGDDVTVHIEVEGIRKSPDLPNERG